MTSTINTSLLNLAERALDIATARQGVIGHNMANIDTPGYRARDVNFAAELKKQLMNGGVTLPVASRQVLGLIERPDGNNVNMDREALLSAQTQLQFSTAVQVVRAEFKRLQMAIEAQ